MADLKISQLSSTTAPPLSASLPIVVDGFTRKISLNTIYQKSKEYTDSFTTDVETTSANWNSVYSTVQSNSAIAWNYQGTDLKSLSSNWQDSFTIVRANSGSNWSYQGTDLKSLSSTWQNVSTNVQNFSAQWTAAGGNPTSSLVIADLSAGAIAPGDMIPAGTNLQQFVERLLVKTFFPSFINPSASLTSNIGSLVESGTTGLTLTVSFNRGAITGKTVAGIWQPSTFQEFRSGLASKYVINNVDNTSSNSLNLSSFIIQDGTNSFSSITTYEQGPQPVNSKGSAFSTQLAAGSATASMLVTGARRGFYGVSSLANTSASVRSLSNSTSLGVSNGSSFTINIPAGSTSVVFAYPATLRDVLSVKYVEGLNAEVKSNFVQTSVLVEGVNGYTAIPYKVYRYVPVEPFPLEATYTVTI